MMISFMFETDWRNMTYSEQVGHLSQVIHVIASNMEMGYGANSEGEIMGATVSILSAIPNSSITRFYGNKPDLLHDQMKQAIGKLKEYGQMSQQDDGEFLSVAPQLPEIETVVREALNTQSEFLKNSYMHLYDGRNNKNHEENQNPTGSAYFHR